MRETLVIESADPQGAAAIALLHEAALEARALYPELFAPDAPMPSNTPLQPRGAYLVASLSGVPVGCGALRPLDDETAELRRMFVRRSARRSGVALALLERLQEIAGSLGYTVLRLETGRRQEAAMALYESLGFSRIPAFGEYVGDPMSVCFEKRLSQEQAMPLEWSDSLQRIDWQELSRLYEVAPLGQKKPSDLQVAFSNSMFRCFVYEAGRLVGAGRALADGVDCAYICDVAVHPSHQGMGLGRQIVAALVERSASHKKIILYAVPGKEPFYRKLGFQRMATAMAIFEDQARARERGLLADE